eukprot:1264268-Alexandrium_andersonii.AAC.1
MRITRGGTLEEQMVRKASGPFLCGALSTKPSQRRPAGWMRLRVAPHLCELARMCAAGAGVQM